MILGEILDVRGGQISRGDLDVRTCLTITSRRDNWTSEEDMPDTSTGGDNWTSGHV